VPAGSPSAPNGHARGTLRPASPPLKRGAVAFWFLCRNPTRPSTKAGGPWEPHLAGRCFPLRSMQQRENFRDEIIVCPDHYCGPGRCSSGNGTAATRAHAPGPGQWQLGTPAGHQANHPALTKPTSEGRTNGPERSKAGHQHEVVGPGLLHRIINEVQRRYGVADQRRTPAQKQEDPGWT
jgi:hypothetical protein